MEGRTVSMEHRIDRLERIHQPVEEPRHVFKIVHPPKGLTQEQENQWRERQQRECEARGVFFFTLDLGAAAVRIGDDE